LYSTRLLVSGLLLVALAACSPAAEPTPEESGLPPLGFTLAVPPPLAAGVRVGDSLDIKHSVPFPHQDPCDFRGDGVDLAEVTDFRLIVQEFPGAPADVLAAQQPLVVRTAAGIEEQPGFAESITVAGRSGYRVTMGVEGCGEDVYYFPLGAASTIVIRRPFVSEFRQSEELKSQVLAVPGVIVESAADTLFAAIVASIRPR